MNPSIPVSQAAKVFIVAGESSGDQLGCRLMRAIHQLEPATVFLGVGGPLMEAELSGEPGLRSLFPMSEIAVMGFVPVILRLRTLLARIHQTANAVIEARPDVLVIIDSPDFTHRVAKIVRKAAPSIPIVNYVSPTVWAWRPGRAKKMRPYVDHLMALLPFEPAVHLRLGGPPCTYVGHPLIEKLPLLQPNAAEVALRQSNTPLILVLPGSRRSEVRRLMAPFGDAVARLAREFPGATFALPAVPHVRDDIVAAIANWPVKPDILDGEHAKYAAFRQARAAIAASGTVTLELALSQIPMVVGYSVSKLEETIVRAVVQVQTAILPNLILGEIFVPEFLQEQCTGEALAAAIAPVIRDGSARDAQLAAEERVLTAMQVSGGLPSQKAAEIVCKVLTKR